MSGLAITAALLVLLQSTAVLATLSQISTSDPAVQQAIVDGHNAVRRAVDPPASNMLEMIWNNEAAANAQQWADGCSMGHSPASQRTTSLTACGENIYMSSNPDPWSAAINSWHSEVNDYKYGVGTTGGAVGHYTQMVWYRSNQLGCGVAFCPNSNMPYFYVCQYCPPGNYQFAYPYKAGPSCGDCPNDCNDKLCTNACDYFNKYGNCADLAESYGCSNQQILSACPASCKCQGKITN